MMPAAGDHVDLVAALRATAHEAQHLVPVGASGAATSVGADEAGRAGDERRRTV